MPTLPDSLLHSVPQPPTPYFLHLASVLGSLLWTEEGENLVTSMRRAKRSVRPKHSLTWFRFVILWNSFLAFKTEEATPSTSLTHPLSHSPQLPPPSAILVSSLHPPSTFFIPCLFYIAIFPLQLHNLIQQLMMKHFQMFGKEPGPIQHIIGGYFNVFIQWIINSHILRVYLLSYVCYSWELTLGLLWAILCLAVDECGEPRLSACHSCSHRPWPRRYARIVIEGLWILMFTTTLESAISSMLIHEMYTTHHYYYAMIDSVMCFMNPCSCTYQNILRPSQAPCCFWRLNRTYFCTCSMLDWEVWWIFWQLFALSSQYSM